MRSLSVVKPVTAADEGEARVLHVVCAGEAGGAERQLINLVTHAEKTRASHAIALFTPSERVADHFPRARASHPQSRARAREPHRVLVAVARAERRQLAVGHHQRGEGGRGAPPHVRLPRGRHPGGARGGSAHRADGARHAPLRRPELRPSRAGRCGAPTQSSPWRRTSPTSSRRQRPTRPSASWS